MTLLRFRSLGAVFLAVVCAAVLGVTSMFMSAFTFGVQAIMAEVALVVDEGWIMGGTDNPVPDAGLPQQRRIAVPQPVPAPAPEQRLTASRA